jgi:hypothetical protein
MRLDGGRFLADLFHKDSIQAALLQKIIKAVNDLGDAAGVHPVGERQPPPPVNGINVKASGELLHVSINHNIPVNRGIHYFVEVSSNDPNFSQPIVHSLGTSRTGPPIALPALDDNGVKQKYYVRAYAQYRGSKPTKPVTFGGPLGPASITLNGTTSMSLLPSTGSGTASPTGQQGGQGFGAFPMSQPIPRTGSSSVPGTSPQTDVTA